MEIKKYCIEGKECIFVEKIRIGFLVLDRCIKPSGENIYINCKKNEYKEVKNKILLKILSNIYDYKVKTDICESDNEK